MSTRRTAPATEPRSEPLANPGLTFSYLRVSTADQNTEKDKKNILLFANDRGWGGVRFVEDTASARVPWRDRALAPLIEQLQSGDRLIVPELSRLGRSILEIMEVLAILQKKGVAVFDVRNQWDLNGSLQSQVLAFAFSLAAQVERDLMSKRTAEGIAAARRRGKRIGRPPGPGKSKLDPYRDAILEHLRLGVPMRTVAKRFRATTPTLIHWLKRHGLYPVEVDKTPVKPQPQPQPETAK